MNAEWHASHPAPARGTPAERLAWHLEHQKHCGCRPIPKLLQPLVCDRPAEEILKPKKSAAKPRKTAKTLRRKGQYWYGDRAADVWEYFVQQGEANKVPVNHWKQALCYRCSRTRFAIDLQFADDPDDDPDVQPDHACRKCTRCGEYSDIFDPEGLGDLPYGQPAVCLCGKEEFEVVGVTAPGGNPNSAWWFYLGLRCVRCGCLGSYAAWLERYNDWRELRMRM